MEERNISIIISTSTKISFNWLGINTKFRRNLEKIKFKINSLNFKFKIPKLNFWKKYYDWFNKVVNKNGENKF